MECIEKGDCRYRKLDEMGVPGCTRKRHEFCPDEEEAGDEDEDGEDGDWVDELDFD